MFNFSIGFVSNIYPFMRMNLGFKKLAAETVGPFLGGALFVVFISRLHADGQ